MRRPTKRAIVLAISAVSLSAAIAVAMVLPGLATPAINATSTVLARGTIRSSISVPFLGGTDVVVAVNTFDPGGSSGWHSHPGGAIVVSSSRGSSRCTRPSEIPAR